jgi:FkbH-like protein
MPIELSWLPELPNWQQRMEDLPSIADDAARWAELVSLAGTRLDFVQTTKLDRSAQKIFSKEMLAAAGIKPLRVALLGSSTLKHLVPGIRVAGFRRKLWLEVLEGEYGMYLQEFLDPSSKLYQFKPNALVLALDAHHVAEGDRVNVQDLIGNLRHCWAIAKREFGCTVMQQTALPIFPPLLGSNEHRLPESPRERLRRFNMELRQAADQEGGVHLLAIEDYAAGDGTNAWYDPALWHRSKQEIHPRVSQVYGDLLLRLIAADRGLSAKCLVLDLDNTLWGGVIGDDGLNGIALGQGSSVGEAFVAFQRYVLGLKRRGVILAVCSKNDEANAIAPFEQHPEMVLRRDDIACFVANWEDKASNLRKIARALNIGLDSLVFVDDNPFERNLVRQELPQVAVPEISDDPSFYIATLADAGYFEAVSITAEDLERNQQYQANAERESLRESSTDLTGYLQNLQMELIYNQFDEISLARVTQLINKTNQFNLTTRRYTEAEVRAVMKDPHTVTLQMRLLDKFGDNGIIAILIARLQQNQDAVIDTWLMSCRVLGRQVEEACLNILAEQARALGARRLIGEYYPTAKNGMVSNLYSRLGFEPAGWAADGGTRFSLDLTTLSSLPVLITMTEATTHAGI